MDLRTILSVNPHGDETVHVQFAEISLGPREWAEANMIRCMNSRLGLAEKAKRGCVTIRREQAVQRVLDALE
jgi:hypothetical protein